MSDIQRYSQLVEPPHNLMKSRKGYWCKYSDHEAERKADRDRITKLEETNRLLRCDLDEAQQVVKTRDQRINAFEEEFGIVAQEEQDNGRAQ